jgi:hypothetical protein
MAEQKELIPLSSAKFHVSATRPDHQIFVPIPQPQTNQ